MSKVKIELDRAGMRALLRSEDMLGAVKAPAVAAVQQLGEGYEVDARVGRGRVNAEVRAVSAKARKENRDHNTILKAIGGAGK